MPVDSGSTAERLVEPAPRITSRRSCQRVEAGFVPIVSQTPGFQEYLFVDAGDGAHLTISLYDDPSGAEQSTRDAVDGRLRTPLRSSREYRRSPPAGFASTSTRTT